MAALQNAMPVLVSPAASRALSISAEEHKDLWCSTQLPVGPFFIIYNDSYRLVPFWLNQ